ncbi:unnamed protein product [Cyclocybe aegerita]|uniref:Uncharacterized protein n=1 Tax=Cyclocybe aegerita TaxID=1973307 RepID=A0A8S0VUT8_CYCAE|nr:unnamed protein product [Cyclocybe aegerita]
MTVRAKERHLSVRLLDAFASNSSRLRVDVHVVPEGRLRLCVKPGYPPHFRFHFNVDVNVIVNPALLPAPAPTILPSYVLGQVVAPLSSFAKRNAREDGCGGEDGRAGEDGRVGAGEG